MKRRLEPIIELELITKTFLSGEGHDGTLRVLRGISLGVRKGEIIAVVGASGAGKSTLLHIIGTLEKPTSGRVLYNGTDVFAMGEEELARFRNLHIGFVFQFHHLLPEFTALENVAMPALIHGKAFSEIRAIAMDLLREVGLEERAEQKPPKLSGGEQQRVAVARALANSPSLILADEPTAALDSVRGRQVMELFRKVAHEQKAAVMVVTHDHRALDVFDRALEMEDGLIRGKLVAGQ